MTGRYLPNPGNLDGAVLLLETSEECPPARRVGWTLMCMGERGLLERFGAVLVGRPATQTWQESRNKEERDAYRSAQREAITEQVRRYNPDAPVVFDLDVGHTNPTTPVPIGGDVIVDHRAKRIEFRLP